MNTLLEYVNLKNNLNLIQNTSSLRDDKKQNLATQLEEITNDNINNPALLGRKKEYFIKLLNENKCALYLDNSGKIMASGVALELANGIYEFGSIYVNPTYRGHEMGKEIIKSLKNIIGQSNTGIMTVKPNKPGNAGMIIDGIKSGMIPVSFEFLKNLNPDGFKECCCCDTFQNDFCGVSDNTCILLIDLEVIGSVENSISYLKSISFRIAIGEEKLKNKILEELQKLVNNEFISKITEIKKYLSYKIIKLGI